MRKIIEIYSDRAGRVRRLHYRFEGSPFLYALANDAADGTWHMGPVGGMQPINLMAHAPLVAVLHEAQMEADRQRLGRAA